MKASKQTICFLCGITILWIIFAVIINPIGNFPIGDDFAYGKQVKIFLDTGKMTITDWSSMTLIGYIYIGAFVCSIFGFSFTVLRITTLIFALLGVIATYFLFREFSIKEKYSALAACLIGFHPTFYYHSFNFMTDIAFYTLSIIVMIFYIRYIKYDRLNQFIIAVLLNIIALLIRDIAIIFPFAFAISYIYKNGFKFKNLLNIFLPIILIVTTYLIWKYWTIYSLGNPKNLNYSQKQFMSVWLSGNIINLFFIYIKNFLATSIYFGLYAFPVILIILYSKYNTYSKKTLFRLILLIVIVFALYILILPKIRHNFYALFYLLSGHIILHNYFFPNVHLPDYDYYIFFPKNIITIISLIGLLGSILFWFTSYHKIKSYFNKFNNKLFTKREGTKEFIILSLLFYLFLIYSQDVFSRYLFIPLVLIILLLLISEELKYKKSIIKVSVIILFFVYYFYSSIASAHDLMEYNRNRFTALNYLDTELKIDRKLIDGGFEYNAYYFYDSHYKPTKTKNTWWVQDDKYVVSWEKIKNYQVIKEYEWARWFPPFNKLKIYAQKRID